MADETVDGAQKEQDGAVVPEKQTGDPGSWGQEELQAKMDKINEIGYLPLNVDINDVSAPDPQASRDETTRPEDGVAPGGRDTSGDEQVRSDTADENEEG